MHYRTVSDTVLWIQSGGNPILVWVMTPRYGAGSDTALWILSWGNPILGRFRHRAIERALTPRYRVGSDTVLWIPSGENPISVWILMLRYGADSGTALWTPSRGYLMSVRVLMLRYGGMKIRTTSEWGISYHEGFLGCLRVGKIPSSGRVADGYICKV